MSEINEQISGKTFLIMRYLFSFISIIPLVVFMILEIQITNIKNIQFSLHIQIFNILFYPCNFLCLSSTKGRGYNLLDRIIFK